MSLTQLTKLCPTKIVYRVRGPSNSVTQLPRLIRCTGTFNLGLVDVTSLVHCHLRRRHFIRQRTMTRLPARFNRFRVCTCHGLLSSSRRITLIGNSPTAFSRNSIVIQIRSRYLAKSTFNSLHYSYQVRLRTTLGVVRSTKQNIIMCLHRRKHNVNLIGGLGTCSLRSLNLSAIRTGRGLNLPMSRHGCKIKTRVLGSVKIGRFYLVAGGPHGVTKLGNCNLRVISQIPLVVRTAPCGSNCLSAGTRGLKRLVIRACLTAITLR